MVKLLYENKINYRISCFYIYIYDRLKIFKYLCKVGIINYPNEYLFKYNIYGEIDNYLFKIENKKINQMILQNERLIEEIKWGTWANSDILFVKYIRRSIEHNDINRLQWMYKRNKVLFKKTI